MEPTWVRIGVMDSRRPQAVATVPARPLGQFERIRRGLMRMLLVSGVLLLVGNVGLVMVPIPHVHLCLFPLAFILGPIVGVAAWRDRAVLGQGAIACPRCGAEVALPAELPGWPARVTCERCAIMVEINLARASP
ncbi:MAG: hypothetical protein AB1938_02020 [Myxococcota bacterium]